LYFVPAMGVLWVHAYRDEESSQLLSFSRAPQPLGKH